MEKVVLSGNISPEDLEKYNAMVIQPDVRLIDISDFSVNVAEDELESCLFADDEDEPSLIAKLLLNKEFASVYVIEGDLVLSSDGRVIVNSFDKNAVVIPDSVEIIGHFAFSNNGIKEIRFPEGIRRIGDVAFQDCNRLTSITLPDTVEQLGEGTFGLCSLQKVKLSNALKSIPAGCFEYNDLDEIEIPASVKEIGGDAFHCNFIEKVTLPEGVESIGWNVFTHENKYIYFPSTMREIAKDFFYEECIDVPEECLPYIDVSEENPLFFSKDGTLYSRENPDVPYLGYVYKEKVEEEEVFVIFPDSQQGLTKEYSPEEIFAKFQYCDSLDENDTMFRIYENGKYNIIDRKLNRYINEKCVSNIQFSRNNFVIINSEVIYSIDLKNILLEEFDGYHFESCDNEGRIYVSKDIPLPEDKQYLIFSPFREHLLYGCININKEIIIPCEYKRLNHFDAQGVAEAKKGSKVGMINTLNRIVIPFEYQSFYGAFDENGLAIVSKRIKGNTKYMFIDRENKVHGVFVEPTFRLHEKEFHLYTNDGLYGFAKQFGLNCSGAIYKDIRVIDEKTIEVSTDGTGYQTITY